MGNKTAKRLSPKHKRFADEYLIDLNGARAYRAIYGKNLSVPVASVNANRVLKNANVAAYIAAKQQKVQDKTDVTLERVINELARVAFFDPRKLFDEHGNIRCITDIDADTAAVIASIDAEDLFNGSGNDRTQIGYIRKVRMWNKVEALKDLLRHLGGIVERHEVAGKNGGPIKTVSMTLEEFKAIAEKITAEV